MSEIFANAEGDQAVGSFSHRGPWLVDPTEMRWRRGTDELRLRTRAEIPRLLAKRTVPPIRRLIRIVTSIGWALGAWYLFDRGRERSRAELSRRLRITFEGLGSTFVKLGQIISSGEGLFPDELVREFRLLRDRVAPESFAEIREVVERDLGAPLSEVFARFDETPIAAASIAQVHAATLLTGEEVVVKVQRPRVERLVREDIEALAWLAPRFVGRIPVAALANPPALVELFTETIVEELDFRLEAENMLDVAQVLAETEQRAIIVARPHPTLVTRRVLVMERLSGFHFDDVESIRDAGIDTYALVRAGLIAFMEGALLFGVFHGDLHSGNLFVRPDGTTALLDFGITGRLDERKRLAFLRLLVMGTAGDVGGQIRGLIELGAFPPDTDVDAVVEDLQLNQPAKDPTRMSADELTEELKALTKKLLAYGARIPKELMLFVKNMVFLDGATGALAPDLDILAEIQHVYMYFAQTHGERILRELGMDPTQFVDLDLDAVKNSIGVAADVESLTFRDLRERRDMIRKRLGGRELA
ncbi:MAG: ABC1 kinase family protein [Acidimicrobiia bacterium]